MATGKAGGILMLVSIFLPVWIINITGKVQGVRLSGTIYYWLFGLLIMMSGGSIWILIWVEIFSILLFIVLLVFSILCIVKEGSTQMVLGIIGLILMAVYLIYIYTIGSFGFGTVAGLSATLIPVGALLCMVGAILVIVGGAQTK